MTYTVNLDAILEGATSGERAGPQANIYQNISHKKVTLEENNKALNTTTPMGGSSQIKSGGEMLILVTPPKGIILM